MAKLAPPVFPHSSDANIQIALGDGRTKIAKIHSHIISELSNEIGEPTAQQRMLIEIIALQYIRIHLMRERVLAEDDVDGMGDEKPIAWMNSIRLNLCALGLERRMKGKTISLTDIIAKHAPDKVECDP